MSRKGKGVILESSHGGYGVGVVENVKARLKLQTLAQDYHDLEKDSDVIRSKLEVAKQRKLTLAAEVRFLRRRYKLLVEAKAINASQEQKLVQPLNSLKPMKNVKEKPSTKKGNSHNGLPPKPKKRHHVGEDTAMFRLPSKPKKRHYAGEEFATRSKSQVNDPHHIKLLLGGKETSQHNLTPVSALNYNGRINLRQENFAWNPPILDLNQKDKILYANDSALRKLSTGFDLNQDFTPTTKEAASLSTRAPIFDLNEISMGDEDYVNNLEAVKFEEAKKNLIRGLNEEQQNDLKLSICRNAGEGSSRVGKRKISWQDPVALRV